MQGYIININKVNDEDLIVTILTQNRIYTSYRFYGARHSTINLGYKIDFELESSLKSDLPRLKDLLQISYPWIFNQSKLTNWQLFASLLYQHLKDIESIEESYYLLLERLSHRLIKQNSKRAIIEAYIYLCEIEGRLHTDYECLICQNTITDQTIVVRGFALLHKGCGAGSSYNIDLIKELFEEKTTINFSNKQIEQLWKIIKLGL